MIFGQLSPDEFVSLRNAEQVSPEGQEALDFARSIEFRPGEPICQGWIDYYSQDFCHAFAMAAHEAFAGTHFVIITNPDELAYEAEDPEDSIPAVVHVYAIVEHEGRDWALDVYGMRPARSIMDEVVERYSAGIVAYDEVTLGGLKHLIRDPQSSSPTQAFRSLAEVSDRVMAGARERVAEVFQSLACELQAAPAPR